MGLPRFYNLRSTGGRALISGFITVNVVEDDDGIVDHQAQTQDQTGQGNDVNREAHQVKTQHRDQEGDRNGERDKEWPPPLPEEGEEHQDREARPVEQTAAEVVDAGAEDGGLVVGEVEPEAGILPA